MTRSTAKNTDRKPVRVEPDPCGWRIVLPGDGWIIRRPTLPEIFVALRQHKIRYWYLASLIPTTEENVMSLNDPVARGFRTRVLMGVTYGFRMPGKNKLDRERSTETQRYGAMKDRDAVVRVSHG